jgi:hypothetical protein
VAASGPRLKNRISKMESERRIWVSWYTTSGVAQQMEQSMCRRQVSSGYSVREQARGTKDQGQI